MTDPILQIPTRDDNGEVGHCPAPGVGLALSGGGSRAIAFHLGCLRALHHNGLLARIDVLSTVSGGSVIGALYASHDGDFSSFEERTVALLTEGLVVPTWRTIFTTRYGVLALLNWVLLFLVALIEIPIALVKRLLIAVGFTSVKKARSITSYLRLHESRTTLLARTLNAQWFQGKTIDQLSSQLVVNACDLTHGSAFYFSPNESGSWRLGKLTDNKQLLAEAVAVFLLFGCLWYSTVLLYSS